MKPAIALGGLALGVTTPQRTRSAPGYFMLPGSGHRFRDWRPADTASSPWKPPSRSPATCISTSSPRCWASRNSRASSRISASAQPTNIDISGERKGILPTPEWKKARFKNAADQVWFPGETVIFGIGQGYLIVTPMQAAHMASILASRGKSYRPRLVTAYREQGTGKIEKIEPKLLETIEAARPRTGRSRPTE